MKFENNFWLPDSETHFQKFLDKFGHYQGEVRNPSLNLMKALGLPRRIAVDVGANIGLWTMPLSEEFKGVYAFEPVVENFICLLRNIGHKGNIVAVNKALDKREGFSPVFCPSNTNCGSYTFQMQDTGGYQVVSTVSLDSYNLTDVDYIKIDVEGWEENVIYGALQTIMRNRPVIVYEANDGSVEPHQMLNRMSYDLRIKAGRNYVAVPREKWKEGALSIFEGSNVKQQP